VLTTLSRRDRRRIDGIRSADRFASYLYSGRPELFLPKLLGRPVDGVTEVMVHPGHPEGSRSATLGNRELERYVASDDRRRELQPCIDARPVPRGWTLTNYATLAREAAAG